MIEINLLPKELQKGKFSIKLDKSIVMVLSGCAILLAVMALYSYFFQAQEYVRLQQKLQEAKTESAKYTTEIAKIDEIGKKKEQILARMSAIELLDRNREYWVGLMQDLAGRVPEYVWLSSLKQAPQAAPLPVQAPNGKPTPVPIPSLSSIEGYSFSLNGLATFIIRLKKSDMFDKIELSSVKLEDFEKADAYSFKLTCNLVPNVINKINTDAQTAQAINSVEATSQDNKF
jgi:Tfp pilus assembly protein PilN